MYSLDIETLIGVLQNRRIKGFLEADLSTGGLSGALKSGFVKVELKDGNNLSIFIRDKNGNVLYQGQEALNKVRRLVLTWQLVEVVPGLQDKESHTDPTFPIQRSPALHPLPSTTKPLPPPVRYSPASDMSACVPKRRQNLPSEHLHYLSRHARSVYGLVNGANSIRRIAGLLSMPIDMVYRELLALQREQLIVIRSDRL